MAGKAESSGFRTFLPKAADIFWSDSWSGQGPRPAVTHRQGPRAAGEALLCCEGPGRQVALWSQHWQNLTERHGNLEQVSPWDFLPEPRAQELCAASLLLPGPGLPALRLSASP